MRYFDVEVRFENDIIEGSKESRDIEKKLKTFSDNYCEKLNNNFYVCFTFYEDNGTDGNYSGVSFIFAGIGTTDDLRSEIYSLWSSTGIKGKIESIEETTYRSVSRSVDVAERSFSSATTRKHFQNLFLSRAEFDEYIVDAINKTKLKEYAKKKHLNTLIDEANRIFSCPMGEFTGHPVHYIISPQRGTPLKTAENLTGALLFQNRLQSNRIVHYICGSNFNEKVEIAALYKNVISGTLLISLKDPDNHDGHARHIETDIKHICKLAVEYQNKVLTIFDIPKDEQRLVEKVLIHCEGKLAFIHISEDAADRKKSVKYLKDRARENEITDTAPLIEMLGTEEKTRYICDLDRIFDHFYSVHLRNNKYPAYASIKVKKAEKINVKGDASRELDEMIGLKEVKSIVKQSVSFFRMQELYKQRNIPIATPARSMVFTGNPGTAKTTVARLIARIFRDNKILENGRLVEVGRADLVGKYVGWTACQVKEAFERARGSVLFIDEAYSLVDDKHGMYGDEAINTIVQEMENHRDETIVIFAGYPDEMEDFLSRNPGLRSRIAFHVHFPDYNEDELMDILKLTIKNRSMLLSAEAEESARSIIASAAKTSDFGNGRFIRNLTEKAVMQMSERLAEKNYETLSDSELVTLQPEDFCIPQYMSDNKPKEKVRIGF